MKRKIKRKRLQVSNRKLELSNTDSITHLNLPEKIHSALLRRNITTIKKFLALKRKRLVKFKGIGTKSITYILRLKHTIKITEKLSEPSSNNPLIVEVKSGTGRPYKLFLQGDFSGSDSIEILGLPKRFEGFLKKAKLETIGDFINFDSSKLHKVKGLGAGIIAFYESLRGILISLPKYTTTEPRFENEKALIQNLVSLCIYPKSLEVVRRRYGLLSGERETLEEIGRSFGVTRERVRQIQAKAIKRMKHPSNRFKKPIISLVENIIVENDYLISGEEGDKLVQKVFGQNPFDGSSFLDLLADLNWIQVFVVGDVHLYTTKFQKSTLGELINEIIQLLKNSKDILTIEEIVNKVERTKPFNKTGINLAAFVKNCTKIHPQIE